MTKALFALSAAATAFVISAPAVARPHGHKTACAKYRHGHCVATHRYKVGYRFGPRYTYTTYSALPRTYVRRYDLTPRYRYVYRDGYIYVVDPTTWGITRILNAY